MKPETLATLQAQQAHLKYCHALTSVGVIDCLRNLTDAAIEQADQAEAVKKKASDPQQSQSQTLAYGSQQMADENAQAAASEDAEIAKTVGQ